MGWVVVVEEEEEEEEEEEGWVSWSPNSCRICMLGTHPRRPRRRGVCWEEEEEEEGWRWVGWG